MDKQKYLNMQGYQKNASFPLFPKERGFYLLVLLLPNTGIERKEPPYDDEELLFFKFLVALVGCRCFLLCLGDSHPLIEIFLLS